MPQMIKMISKKRKRVVGNINWNRKHIHKDNGNVSHHMRNLKLEIGKNSFS